MTGGTQWHSLFYHGKKVKIYISLKLYIKNLRNSYFAKNTMKIVKNVLRGVVRKDFLKLDQDQKEGKEEDHGIVIY